MVSIIIPCHRKGDADWCVERIKQMYIRNFEVLVIDDELCLGVPAKKRDFGAEIAQGDILAFIDSDAYPPPDWLNNARGYITNFALGGPSVLPPDSTLKERIADEVYRHLPFSYRVKPTKPMIVKEMPTSNLFVRKDRFMEVGGFGCDCLTGEDTLLCEKLGGCLYIPELIVYHRRRPIYHPLFKQVANYGRQRGMFFRAYLGTVWSYVKNFIGVFLKRRV